MSIRNGLKILLVILFPLNLQAQEQDITGLWKGFMYNDTTQQNLRYELAISFEKGKYHGFSHQYFIVGDKEYHGVKKLKIKRDGDEITTEEVDLIVHNYPVAPAKGVWQKNTLVFTIKGNAMVLSGPYMTNRTRNYHPVTGYVHVERNYDYKQSALVPHLEELNLTKNLTFLTEALASASEDNFVLKPITSDEEIKAFVVAVQKQDTTVRIKLSNTPEVTISQVAAVKEPEVKKEPVTVAPKETKDVAAVTPPAQKEIKQPAVVKETPKATPPIVTTAPKKTEPVATNKPAETVVAKTTAPVAIAAPKKTETAPTQKPVEPAVVKTVNPPSAPAAKPVAQKPQVVIDPTAAVDIAKRKVETIKALYFKSDSLTLTLYDNGEVDGDTVSVIMNGNIIMAKVGLTTNAVKKTIYTNQIEGDSIQLVMYAESLGTLPPNTGLLIVNDGGDRYEIRFSGDMQKSSAIVFRRRKE